MRRACLRAVPGRQGRAQAGNETERGTGGVELNTNAVAAVSSLMRTAAALLEIALVFVAGALATRGIPDGALPDDLRAIVRMVLILVAAGAVDWTLRRRGPASWGLTLGTDPPRRQLLTAVRLLVLAGIPALAVTLAAERQAGHMADPGQWSAAGLLIPLLAQEVFLLGYAHTRLGDRFTARVTAGIVALFFVAAHAGHALERPYAWAFLAAMAWQGAWWSFARTAGQSLAPLALAHVALLMLYGVPAAGLVGLVVVALLVLRGSGAWARSLISAAALPSAHAPSVAISGSS